VFRYGIKLFIYDEVNQMVKEDVDLTTYYT
jgi:hypothetical protein